MSERHGDFVTLDELIATIGVDATRWFMVSRSHESTIDLDIELAAKQDAENPVYYVQYAHARIASILRNASTAVVEWRAGESRRQGVALNAAERELIRKLFELPPGGARGDRAARAAPDRRLRARTGQAFAAFYRDSPVLKEPGADLQAFRLALCVASQTTLASALGLLGVSAPEAM